MKKKPKEIILYIKESPMGLKYLGVTSKDLYTYRGSGKYWKAHLKKHNIKTNEIRNSILLKTTSKEEIKVWGLFYSKLFNVVTSKEWANLMPESGELSVLGLKHSIESRLKSSNSHKSPSLITKLKERSIGNKYALGSKGPTIKVIQYDRNMNFIKEWDSQILASKTLKINNGNISGCCLGLRKTAGNYIWKFKNNKNEKQ